jgi:hypothetical protein
MSDSVHEKCVQVNWGDSPEKTKNVSMTNKERREVKAEKYVHCWVGNLMKKKPTTTTDDQFETNYHFLPKQLSTARRQRHQRSNAPKSFENTNIFCLVLSC